MELLHHTPGDAKEIQQLFVSTFSDSEGPAEGELIGRLVKEMLTCTDAEDLYCFVATENGEIIGSVCFTKMRFESDIRAFILSPMAIGTDHQGKGKGQKLINFGINELKKMASNS